MEASMARGKGHQQGGGGGTNNSHRRKRRSDWRDGPAFLDATSTVSASTFGARRLPELKNLYFQNRSGSTTASLKSSASVKDNDDTYLIHERQNLLSGGGKRSSRHLRRRTTAIQSKKHRHRYPFPARGVLAAAAAFETDGGEEEQPTYKGATRKSRRKKRSHLEGEHLKWLLINNNNNDNNNDNDNDNDPVTANPTETTTGRSQSCPNTNKSWLVTHLWHSKRFHLLSSSPNNNNRNNIKNITNEGKSPPPAPAFGGWTGIPLVHTNRGPRAALRLSQNKDGDDDGSSSSISSSSVMVRDVTWEGQPLVLCIGAGGSSDDSSKQQQQQQQQPSREEQFLLQHLGRICPGLLTLNNSLTKKFLSGDLSLEEIVYEPDSFPSRAIGPAVWRMLPNGDHRTATAAAIEIRCHPSIRPRIQNILQKLEANNKIISTTSSSLRLLGMDSTSFVAVPRICFRLYGVASLDVLNKVLKPQRNQGSSDVVSTVTEMQRGAQEPIHKNSSKMILPNGSIVRIDSVAVAGAAANQNGANTDDDVTLIYRAPRPLDCSANRAIAGWEVHCSDATFAKALWLALVTFDGDGDSASSSSAAAAAAAATCHDITNGAAYADTPPKQQSIRGCCAIGLIEDCHMRLECEPPIPIFPRDHVDTQDSEKYWMPSSSSSSSSSLTSSSWKHIRQLCESGWGRLPIDKKGRLDKLENIDFGELVATDEAEGSAINENEGGGKEGTKPDFVVVRGDFGQPFVVVIQGSCGNYTPKKAGAGSMELPSTGVDDSNACDTDGDPSNSDQRAKKRRRNRRPARPKNQVILSPPLSKAFRANLGEYCHQLSSSLSLPAVLLVHVRALGNGKIRPGMTITCAGGARPTAAATILGRITAGGFSTSRGVCHGIGVVGAIRLLDYMGRITTVEDPDCNGGGDDDNRAIQNTAKSYGRVVRLPNGSQSLQLWVRVKNMPKLGGSEKGNANIVGCEASLSVMI